MTTLQDQVEAQPEGRLLNIQEAAQYLRLPLAYLRIQVKHRTGPKFISPSPKVKFFSIEDLDAWRSTWTDK